jgi:hypothetical protein
MTTTAHLSNTLPPPTSERQVAEARTAIVASIANLVDRELQGRASMLHANAAAIERQQRDVARTTESLRRENVKLGKVAADAAEKIKEIGNVQNWAEVLEREFLVLEETARLVAGDWESESEGSWTGSETASVDGSVDGDRDQHLSDGISAVLGLDHTPHAGEDEEVSEDYVPVRPFDKGKGCEIIDGDPMELEPPEDVSLSSRFQLG